MWTYRIRLRRDDNATWLVTAPDFPELATFGRTAAEARRQALAAIEEAIASRMADREAIPGPSKARHFVELPAQTVAKILLYRTMRAKGVSKNELARRLRWHRPQVDRLLNLRHASRTDAIEAALGALGARLRIEVEDRAA